MRTPDLAGPTHHRPADEALHEIPVLQHPRDCGGESRVQPGDRLPHRAGSPPPSHKKPPRGRRRPDPLAGLWDSDFAYVAKDQAETGVLFELIGSRSKRRSLLITANQPFGDWGRIFPNQAMTLAAIDRLVHHATIFEMNVESYRRRAALERKRGPGRPPSRATINANLVDAPRPDA